MSPNQPPSRKLDHHLQVIMTKPRPRAIPATRDPIQESTHNFYRSRLKSFFMFCVNNGWLQGAPLVHITQSLPTCWSSQPTTGPIAVNRFTISVFARGVESQAGLPTSQLTVSDLCRSRSARGWSLA